MPRPSRRASGPRVRAGVAGDLVAAAAFGQIVYERNVHAAVAARVLHGTFLSMALLGPHREVFSGWEIP